MCQIESAHVLAPVSHACSLSCPCQQQQGAHVPLTLRTKPTQYVVLVAHCAQVEAKERHADDVRKDVELASIEADKILADQVELDFKIKVRSESSTATHPHAQHLRLAS